MVSEAKITYKNRQTGQLSVLRCEDNFHFPMHFHDRYVIWTNPGSGEHLRFKRKKDILLPDHFSIIAPGVSHSNYGCREDRRSLRSFYVDTAFIHNLIRQISKGKSLALEMDDLMVKHPRLARDLSQLHDLLINSEDSLESDEKTYLIFSEVLNRCLPRLTPITIVEKSKDRVQKVIDYMHAYSEEPHELNELAEIADCTPYYLIRLFKKQTGMSPHAYFRQIKLDNAMRYLNKGVPLSETAANTGFSDQSHLTRQFKQRFGITPGQYIRMIQSR